MVLDVLIMCVRNKLSLDHYIPLYGVRQVYYLPSEDDLDNLVHHADFSLENDQQ